MHTKQASMKTLSKNPLLLISNIPSEYRKAVLEIELLAHQDIQIHKSKYIELNHLIDAFDRYLKEQRKFKGHLASETLSASRDSSEESLIGSHEVLKTLKIKLPDTLYQKMKLEQEWKEMKDYWRRRKTIRIRLTPEQKLRYLRR